MRTGYDDPHHTIQWEVMHVDLRGKKVIAIGERDGVQATAIAEVARSAGAEVLLELNQCFV